MAPVPPIFRRDDDSEKSSDQRFKPSLRYLLSAWHLNRRVANSPFSYLQEKHLCRLALRGNPDGTPLSWSSFRSLAYRYASRHKTSTTQHLHSWKHLGGRAGKTWVRQFVARNPELRHVLNKDNSEPSLTSRPNGTEQVEKQQSRDNTSVNFISTVQQQKP